MSEQDETSLAPTPAEMAGMVFAAYFFWFLANGAKGAIAGAAGVSAGIVLSRAVAAFGPLRGSSQGVWLLVIVGFVVAAPFLSDGDFRTSQMAIAAYTAIAILGLNLLTGYTGQGSIGHSAFMGMGGYGAAILVNEWDVNITLAMVVAMLFAALAGLLIGIPALRLSGPYLAIATLGLAVVFTPLVKLDELKSITGGQNGINLFQRAFGPPVDWSWLSDARWYYFLTMASLGVGVLLLYNLLNSAVGRSFRAVRDNELAAAAMGVNVANTKLAAFAISSAYAGFAGGFLFILQNRYVSPDSFSVLMSIELLLAMVIGGMASIPGSLIGAFFLVYVYKEGLGTVSTRTEDGSDTWLLMVGSLIAAAVLLGNPWINDQVKRYGGRLHAQLGTIVLSLIRIAAIVGLAFGFAWIFRGVTDAVVKDFVTLRGAMTGVFLILIVLFLPTGLIGFVSRIRMLTWGDLLGIARNIVAPSAASPEEDGTNAHTQ